MVKIKKILKVLPSTITSFFLDHMVCILQKQGLSSLLAVCDRFRLILPRREIGYIQISADFIAIIKIDV